MGFYHIPASYDDDLKVFEEKIKEFKDGKIDAVKFRAIRVAFGCYEQRKENTFMIRVRCPGGMITPQQFLIAAELSKEYGGDELHITTRQELQIHHVKFDNILPVIHELKKIDLCTRGGGGNTLRNITASVDAGIAPDEDFDVTPWCVALTERLIDEPDSWNLPRKYKIAFSGNEKDNSLATITDLGFIAKVKDGKKGFRVYIAGGMGKKSNAGHLIYDFVSEEKVYFIAAAVKKMFDKHGNRRKKYASRLRFLWQKLGREAFVGYLEEELKALEASGLKPLHLKEFRNADISDIALPVEEVHSEEFNLWKKRYVKPQKQSGLVSVLIPVVHGNITYQAAQRLSYFLSNLGENVIRLSLQQNILLRNIPQNYLGNVYDVVREITPLMKREAFYGNLVSCTGAEACKLGICLSRNASYAIMDTLAKESLSLDLLPEGFRTYISGCPNACGQHPLADIGFFGRASRHNGEIYPSYRIVAGAHILDGETKLAEEIAEVPGKRVPEFLARFLKEYLPKAASHKTFSDYLEKEGKAAIVRLAADFAQIPDKAQDESFYIDWGASQPLSLKDVGTDECSAGLFDMIDVDEREIKKTLKSLPDLSGDQLDQALHHLAFLSSRLLLITRGLDTYDEEATFNSFLRHFIEEGIVAKEFKPVVLLAKAKDVKGLRQEQAKVVSLAEAMLNLYDDMDDSLRFTFKQAEPEQPKAEEAPSRKFKDFRKVGCPMNFVKTKLVLETMGPGEILEIYLDDGAPITNVPRSVTSEGHTVLEQKRIENYWSVTIQKAGASNPAQPEKPVEPEKPKSEEAKPNKFKDFRNVGCPMNFVKTKLVLEMMAPGEILEILLDDGAPITNVPRSVTSEGHTVLEQKRIDNHWSVTIKKAGK